MKFSVNVNATRVPRAGQVDTERVPTVGDAVTLKAGAYAVKVLVIEAHDRNCRGVVAAFDPPVEFANGILVGDFVHFGYLNVFDVARLSNGVSSRRGSVA
jgi:hypothetical protein